MNKPTSRKVTTYAALALLSVLLANPASAFIAGNFLKTQTGGECSNVVIPHGPARWSYKIAGGIPDDLLYAAQWTYTAHFTSGQFPDGSGCTMDWWTCDVLVSDGSHFEAFYTATTHAGTTFASSGDGAVVTGEYKGVAVYGGSLGCRGYGVDLNTFIGGLVPLEGTTNGSFPALA